MIKNENYNSKVEYINKTYIDQDVDIETNIENIACLGKKISLCNKQHLSKVKVQFIKKLSNTETKKKDVA